MLYNHIQEALSFLKKKIDLQPKYGIVLGTGLGQLAKEIAVVAAIPYGEIPHFPVSTVESHAGELLLGYLEGTPVVAMSGRFHYYEGYSMKEVTFPIRVLKFLGIEALIISNASGGTHPDFKAGDIVVVRDHINLQPEHPLRGVNDERLGPRFPDMLQTYDLKMRKIALEIAKNNNIPIHTGIYVGLQGPSLETPAEYEYIQRIGGDLVGMSTVPEVIVARHMNVPVCVLSVVTNQCIPISQLTETTVAEVITVAQSAEPKLTMIVKGMLLELGE